MNDAYQISIASGYVITQHSSLYPTACISLQRIEDVNHSIPDEENPVWKERVPQILGWVDHPVPWIRMPWPLAEGVFRMGQYTFNHDLLPQIDAKECSIKLLEFNGFSSANAGLAIKLPDRYVLLANKGLALEPEKEDILTQKA